MKEERKMMNVKEMKVNGKNENEEDGRPWKEWEKVRKEE